VVRDQQHDRGHEPTSDQDAPLKVEEPDIDKTKTTRRVVAKGAAWAVPSIALAAKAPAQAVSGCPDIPGNYYVVMYSPFTSGPNVDVLQDRAPATDGFGSVEVGGCTSGSPGFSPTAGFTRVLANDIGLNRTGINISHNVQLQNRDAVTFSLSEQSCCTIQKIVGHLHRFGAATNPDCPNPYYRTAALGDTFLPITAGGYGTKSVTVRPSTTQGLCGGQGVHWGSPRSGAGTGCSGDNQHQNNAFSYGQPFGFLYIEVACTGTPTG